MTNSAMVQKIGFAFVFCIAAVWATIGSPRSSPLKSSDKCIHDGRVCPSKFTVYANETVTLNIKIKLNENERFIKDKKHFIKVSCDDFTKLMVKVTDFDITSKHDLNVTNTSYFGDRLKEASIEKINSTSFQLVIVINNITLEDNKKRLIIGLWTSEHHQLDQTIVLDVFKATPPQPTSTTITKTPIKTTPDTAEIKDNGLSDGIIALIVILIILVLAIIAYIRYRCYKKRRDQLRERTLRYEPPNDSDSDKSTAKS